MSNVAASCLFNRDVGALQLARHWEGGACDEHYGMRFIWMAVAILSKNGVATRGGITHHYEGVARHGCTPYSVFNEMVTGS